MLRTALSIILQKFMRIRISLFSFYRWGTKVEGVEEISPNMGNVVETT